MTLEQLEKLVGMALPVTTFLALVVTVVLIAKTKGEQDAKKNTIETWKGLAESREEALEEERFKSAELTRERDELKRMLKVQKEALCLAIDELVDGFRRAGVNLPTPRMKECQEKNDD